MDFLKPVFESGRIDFVGQGRASKLATALVSGAGVVSLAVGFAMQQLELSFYTFALGIALTYAVVLPPWPFFRQSPVAWLSRKTPDSPAATTAAAPRRTLVEDNIKQLLKRIDKHFINESRLQLIIWQTISDDMLSNYQRIVTLLARTYESINLLLDFTQTDLKRWLSER
ncbi:hypothetical protein GGF43_001598, partial [Coemansia sp. RSA 2618]